MYAYEFLCPHTLFDFWADSAGRTSKAAKEHPERIV
jgi:hypothetical protein